MPRFGRDRFLFFCRWQSLGAQLGIVSCVNVADRAFCKLQNIWICFSGDFLFCYLGIHHHETPPFGRNIFKELFSNHPTIMANQPTPPGPRTPPEIAGLMKTIGSLTSHEPSKSKVEESSLEARLVWDMPCRILGTHSPELEEVLPTQYSPNYSWLFNQPPPGHVPPPRNKGLRPYYGKPMVNSG